jgi:hypothetical protein
MLLKELKKGSEGNKGSERQNMDQQLKKIKNEFIK